MPRSELSKLFGANTFDAAATVTAVTADSAGVGGELAQALKSVGTMPFTTTLS